MDENEIRVLLVGDRKQSFALLLWCCAIVLIASAPTFLDAGYRTSQLHPCLCCRKHWRNVSLVFCFWIWWNDGMLATLTNTSAVLMKRWWWGSTINRHICPDRLLPAHVPRRRRCYVNLMCLVMSSVFVIPCSVCQAISALVWKPFMQLAMTSSRLIATSASPKYHYSD